MRGGERTDGDRDRCRTRVEKTQYQKRHARLFLRRVEKGHTQKGPHKLDAGTHWVHTTTGYTYHRVIVARCWVECW